jgi:hypothetical protein
VWRTPGQWRALARSAGLPIVPYDSDHPDDEADEGDRTVLVIDGRVVDSPAAGSGPGARCRERLGLLARTCGLDMMEVRLDAARAVRGVSFLPPLRQYGRPCADAVLAALARRRMPGAVDADLVGAR